MRTIKVLIISLFFVGAMCILSPQAAGQCKLKHEVITKRSESDAQKGAIYIKIDEPVTGVVFKLYEESNGAFTLIADSRQNFSSNESKLVFDKIKLSTYHIIAEWGGCKTGIGGLNGIILNQ